MKAVVAQEKGGPAALIERQPPRLRENGYILVRTVAVALNPADVLLLEYMAEAGNLLGCDYAGIIEEVGPGVHRNFKKGDRVCGPQRAGDPLEPENGTFAELICVKADMAMHIPDDMTFEQASALGVGVITTGRCLYQKLKLPWPTGKLETSPGQLFVYGGSSMMGTMVIQFAKLSGYEVITTASPHNFNLCRVYGADHVFDYRDPSSPDHIRGLTKNTLTIAIDCISTEEAAAFCAQVLCSGGQYSGILLAKCLREDVASFNTVGYSFLGEEWEQFGVINPVSMEDFHYSKDFAELSEKLLRDGHIRPHPIDVRSGLEAIPAALDELRLKKISGKKIVVTV